MRRCCPILAFAVICFLSGVHAAGPRPVYVVPNFHPASCGWLTDWSTERNYCANSYLDHLDRVRDDPNYNFALSECNNLIAISNFTPQRFDELKQRIREGRVELCNAFFLEPTINLSGGEALVKMGVEGLRWQQEVMGARPRLSWMIDVTGVHEQMAQIVTGLGLDALVYCRLNPTGSTLHWLESPDGTRSLAISPGHYLEWRPMFGAKEPLTEPQLRALAEDVRQRIGAPSSGKDERADSADLRSAPRKTPAGAPVLILGGSGDYSLAPLYRPYPTEFLSQFQKTAPELAVQFAPPGRYLDAILPGIQSGAIPLPTLREGTGYTYKAFWIQNSRVKTWFRQCEQQLRNAEMLATAASLRGQFEYPVQDLYRAWLLLCLNMDRNTLWGAAGGMVFEDSRSWDARDRFEWIEKTSRDVASRALRVLCGSGERVVRFNPLNWPRKDLPEFKSCGSGPSREVDATQQTGLPATIETKFYTARIDPSSGALVSLKLSPSGREVLGGPANVIVAEQPRTKIWSTADQMADRPERSRLADSTQPPPTLAVRTAAGALVVEAESSFLGGGRLRRTTTFHRDSPRIEFETELNDIPDRTVVLAEFPLASEVREVRRGIPYGFAQAARSAPNSDLPASAQGISPAVRWSHYQLEDAGVALLDQGLTGREITGNVPVVFLCNANDAYRGHPNPWLSGKGRQVLRYALQAHEGRFTDAEVARAAWEYNNPPLEVGGCATAELPPLVETSENLILEALRREGGEIELRLVECLGQGESASVTLNLPHDAAFLTNMVGEHRRALRGGPRYEFPVRPQEIVTIRCPTAGSVAAIQPLTRWDELVPETKRTALHRYQPAVKGHPPADWLQPVKKPDPPAKAAAYPP